MRKPKKLKKLVTSPSTGSVPAFSGVSQFIHLGETESTQTVAKKLAGSGSPEGTLVWADRQTRGRGRMDRRWNSPPGGLYFTWILKPPVPTSRLGNLSVVAARGVAAALGSLYGVKTVIKPPNDVLAWQPGLGRQPRGYKKVAGILIETTASMNRTEWVLVGVGVNLNNSLPRSLKDAVSIRQICGPQDPEKAMRAIMGALSQHYMDWLNERCQAPEHAYENSKG